MRATLAASGSARVICTFVVATMGSCMSDREAKSWQEHPTNSAQIEYDVRISDPESGLVRVRAEISLDGLAGAPTLGISFRDLRRHPDALKDLRALSNDRALPIEVGAEGHEHARTIDLRGASRSVIIEYTVDPTFYPPGSTSDDPADARARVVEGLAVLRTSSVFPIFDHGSDSARVTFTLPDDWVAVTPWVRDGDGFWLSPEDLAAIDYLGLGLLDVREVTVQDTVFLISTPHKATGLGAEQATKVIQHYLALIGTPPPHGSGPRSVIIVPSRFMHGGAAGNRSIVQHNSAVTLAHEAFHWWTHSDLVRSEAKWFSEGFTNYYGIKAASGAALVTKDEAAQCFADLSGEMRYLELDGVRSLEGVSGDYAQDGRARRLVYSKGTLLALFLHRELAKRDRSLDEVIKAILSQRRRSLTNEDLRRFFVEEYGNGVAASLDGFVKEATALPDLGLGPATGSSGCARYLPGR